MSVQQAAASLAAFGAAVLLSSPALAVTETYLFTGTNFGPTSELLSVSGQFTLTYDPAVGGTNLGTVDAFSIDTNHPSFNLSSVIFDNILVPNGGGSRTLFIGGVGATANVNGVNTARDLYTADRDFRMQFGIGGNGVVTPFPQFIGYTSANANPRDIYTSAFGGATITRVANPVITPVPEPTSWLMMLLGFGLVGAAARRQGVLPSRMLPARSA